MPAAAVDSVLFIPKERNLGLTFLLLFCIRAIRPSVLQETGFASSILHEAQRLHQNYNQQHVFDKRKLQATELFHSGTSIRSMVWAY